MVWKTVSSMQSVVTVGRNAIFLLILLKVDLLGAMNVFENFVKIEKIGKEKEGKPGCGQTGNITYRIIVEQTKTSLQKII